MARIFHFENDLYYINEQISVLQTVTSIDIDEHYFFDKLVEDVLFIDEVIGKITDQLKEQPGSIDLKHVYRNLSLTKKRYTDLLDSFILNADSINLPIVPFVEKFSALKKRHEDENSEIGDLLMDHTEENSDLVSSEEYQFLFHDENQQE